MFKISTIHQHTSFNPNRRSRRSLGLRTVCDMPLHACAWAMGIHFLSSFVVSLSNPNVFRLLPVNSIVTLSGPYPIKRYKISINALTSSVSVTSEVSSMTLLEIIKNRRLIITNTIENLCSELVKEVIINRFHLKMQLLPATRQDSGEFIFQSDFHSAQDTLVF